MALSSQTKKRWSSGKLPGASFLTGHKRKALGGRGEGFLKGQMGIISGYPESRHIYL